MELVKDKELEVILEEEATGDAEARLLKIFEFLLMEEPVEKVIDNKKIML